MTEIVEKEYCMGCTACSVSCPKQAIAMKESEKGFLYPTIDQTKCIDCKICQKVCPAIVHGELLRANDSQAYAVQHYNGSVLYNSSSGGAFTALSDYVLKNHGVVYGAQYTEDMVVEHRRADNTNDRNLMRDSKYVQSRLNDIFKAVLEDLENGKMVMFTGVPCQCAGLRSFLKKDYSNCYIVEIFCHSTPSPKVFADHIDALEKANKSKVVAYSSRSKKYGWTRHDAVTFSNGKTDDSSMLSQMYYELFNLKMIARDSCKFCQYGGIKRCADLSIGDFWGCREVTVPFTKSKGVSVMLVNTSKGQQLLSEVTGLQAHKITVDEAFKRNHSAPIKFNSNAQKFWDEYQKNGYIQALKKYAGYTFVGRVKFALKRLVRRLRTRH